MKIIAFGASSSKKSINKALAQYSLTFFDQYNTELLDLNDYQVQLFSIDEENESGIPEKIKQFVSKMEEADLLIISFAEHNGSYTTAFKNILDWGSRLKPNLFAKKMFILSTSPGQMGGKFVMEAAKSRLPRHGAEIIASFSLPTFHENFDQNAGILNQELKAEFEAMIEEIKKI